MADALRLLVVEDDTLSARLAVAQAELSGHSALAVGSLAAALSLLAVDRAWDGALVDLRLPDSHGPDTVRAIHAVAPSLPIVAWTANDEDGVRRAVVLAGAADVAAKGVGARDPIRAVVLVAESARRCTERRAVREEVVRLGGVLQLWRHRVAKVGA